MEASDQRRPSLARRALAILILAVIAWLLLKFVISVVAGIATLIVVVLAVIAGLWALSQL